MTAIKSNDMSQAFATDQTAQELSRASAMEHDETPIDDELIFIGGPDEET